MHAYFDWIFQLIPITVSWNKANKWRRKKKLIYWISTVSWPETFIYLFCFCWKNWMNLNVIMNVILMSRMYSKRNVANNFSFLFFSSHGSLLKNPSTYTKFNKSIKNCTIYSTTLTIIYSFCFQMVWLAGVCCKLVCIYIL